MTALSYRVIGNSLEANVTSNLAAGQRQVLQLRGVSPSDTATVRVNGVPLAAVDAGSYGQAGYWVQPPAHAEMACPHGSVVVVCPIVRGDVSVLIAGLVV